MIMRSCGTSTRSNIRMASPSSKRLLSGRSKRFSPRWKLSRHRIDRPGAFIGTTKASTNFSSPGLARIVGADVALVGDRRERREHAAAADDDALGRRSTTCTACDGASSVERSDCGSISAWVTWKSFSRQMLDHALRAGRRLGLAQRPQRHRLVDQEGRHEIGQPPHQAEGALGAQVKAAGERRELLARARLEIGRAHRLARRRRR